MSTAPAEETPPAKKSKRLKPEEWTRIEALWKAGSVTYGELVKRYGLTVSAFEQHFRKAGIKKGQGRAAIQKAADAAVAREEINDATVLAARVRETKEEHYKISAALARLTWNEVLVAKKNNVPMANILGNLKSLDAAASALKKCREERFAVLGLDRTDAIDPDAIPELIISELTPEQVKALRDRDHTEVEDAPTVIGEVGVTAPEPDEDDNDDAVVTEGVSQP